jgi:hypothetical protein
VFLADQPPFAVVLNTISSGDKAVPGKTILPVVNAEDRLKVYQRNKRMPRGIKGPVSVFHAPKVNLPERSRNGTNLQKYQIFHEKLVDKAPLSLYIIGMNVHSYLEEVTWLNNRRKERMY